MWVHRDFTGNKKKKCIQYATAHRQHQNWQIFKKKRNDLFLWTALTNCESQSLVFLINVDLCVNNMYYILIFLRFSKSFALIRIHEFQYNSDFVRFLHLLIFGENMFIIRLSLLGRLEYKVTQFCQKRWNIR